MWVSKWYIPHEVQITFRRLSHFRSHCLCHMQFIQFSFFPNTEMVPLCDAWGAAAYTGIMRYNIDLFAGALIVNSEVICLHKPMAKLDHRQPAHVLRVIHEHIEEKGRLSNPLWNPIGNDSTRLCIVGVLAILVRGRLLVAGICRKVRRQLLHVGCVYRECQDASDQATVPKRIFPSEHSQAKAHKGTTTN